jgi:hypothetical protein
MPYSKSSMHIYCWLLLYSFVSQSPAKRTRRNFDISPKVLKEALLGCGGRDAQTGVACGTVAEVTEYVAKQQGLTLDRALHNAVYQRLRNGKVSIS